MCTCSDRDDIAETIARYATCLDQRDWAGLSEVFDQDAVAYYGDHRVEGLGALRRWIARFLDVTGPTQHLLGQHVMQVDGGEATSATAIRVIHVGAGDRSTLRPYETIGTYHDELRRGPDGWRIHHRRFEVRIELGDRRILAPRV